MNSNSIVWPGAIERYLSCGETIAAWKSIECIIGAAVSCTPGTASSLRLVMEKRILSPTRARTVGPGTWSPNVQALNFTPGAISMILWVVSRRTFLTGAGSSGFSSAPMLSEPPSAKAPLVALGRDLGRHRFQVHFADVVRIGGRRARIARRQQDCSGSRHERTAKSSRDRHIGS